MIKNMGKVKAKKVITQPSRLVPSGLGGGTDNPTHPAMPSPPELRHDALVQQQVQERLKQLAENTALVNEKIKSQGGDKK